MSPRASCGLRLAAAWASPRRGPPRGSSECALTGLSTAPHPALGSPLSRRQNPHGPPMKCRLPNPAAATSSAGGRDRAVRGGSLGGSGGGGARKGGEKGALSVRLTPGASLWGGRGVFFAEPGLKPTCLGCGAPALCSRSLRRAPRPGVLELPAGSEWRRGGSPGGSAAQPLHPTASNRRDPGRSSQACRTIPDSTGLGFCYWSASGAESPFVTRRNRASLSRTRGKRTVGGSGSNFLLHGLN